MPTLDETTRQVLALPREAGTPEAAAARELIAAHLAGLGYTVTVQKFSFAPSSLRAFPLFGDGLGLLALILFPLLGSGPVPPWVGFAVWAGGITALAIVCAGVGLGWVPLGEGLREDANLIATRGDTRPHRWVVAHLDSKAQAHSMAGRLMAVWLVGIAIAALTVLAALRFQGPIPQVWLVAGLLLGLLAGFFARRGRLRGYSLGARDNGTGVVAALTAAEAAPDARLGVVITGAEEFGLVGARVFAQLATDLEEREFVNLDTIDQEGLLYLVSHNARGERLARTVAPWLAELNLQVKRRRLPLGIFVDSAPLAQAGASALTIGRLSWRTLRVIHTPADTPDALSFRTAEQVGRAIASN